MTKQDIFNGYSKEAIRNWSSDPKLTPRKLAKYSVAAEMGWGVSQFSKTFGEWLGELKELDDEDCIRILANDGVWEFLAGIEVDHDKKCVYLITNPTVVVEQDDNEGGAE